MRLAKVEIQGFRCLRDVTLAFDELTVLLGSNSTGKSSALKALKFFFDGDRLEEDDVYGRTGAGRVVVRATFNELTAADRAAFGVYAQGEQMVLTRTWEAGESKLTGRGLRFPDFQPVREAQGAARTKAYRALKAERPTLGLAEATTMAAVDEAMLAWEMDNVDQCEHADQDASQLFGYRAVGQSVLGSRFRFVFVPGLRDAAQEGIEQKGSLLERLLAAIADQRAEANEELIALEAETRRRYAEVIEESHGPTLRGLAQSLETHLQRYVPNASITLDPVEAPLKVGPPLVRLRGGEAHDLSDLGRQGHGFQRTFIIAALEYLAETVDAAAERDDRPTLFFAIEEPELYQHPPRARHFFSTLRNLANQDRQVQVCYATHSPYFIAASEYASIRIFRRTPADEEGLPAGAAVAAADRDAVAAALPAERRADLERYLARTMRDAFCEAFFASAAVLVEGPTDAAVIVQAARLMDVDLLARGVVFVPVTKSAQLVAVSILKSLEVPTYVVFDGDSHSVDDARDSAASLNRSLLDHLGGPVEDFPADAVAANWACFGEELERYLHAATPAFQQDVSQVCADFGWSKAKAPEVYAEAIDRAGAAALPAFLRDVVVAIGALVHD